MRDPTATIISSTAKYTSTTNVFSSCNRWLFTDLDDKILKGGHATLGNQWDKISRKHFNGLSSDSIMQWSCKHVSHQE